MSGAPGVRRDRPRLLLRLAVLLGAPPAILTTEPRAPSGPFWGPVVRRAALLFAPIAVAATAGFGLVYLITLDTTFRSAFSPQVQIAAEAAARLDAGATPESVLPTYSVDMARTRYPYLIVYDQAGQPVAASVQLEGRQPAPPAAAFEYARTGVEHHDSTWYAVYAGPTPWIVWTPRPDVSSAVVIQPWSGGFVLAGRSPDPPAGGFAVAWALTLVVTATACLVLGVVHPLGPRPASPGGDGGGGPDRDPSPPPRPRGRRTHGFRPIVRTRRRSRPRSRT
jgi:hypothetical protein